MPPLRSSSILSFISFLILLGVETDIHAQAPVPGPAETPAHVESTRPAVSPDGQQVLIVDHLQPVDDTGHRDEFSGILRLRISASDGGTTRVRARQIEAPRVRTVRVPQWLDARWAAFEYSISRASRGVAYVDSASGRVVQLEIVTATGGRRVEPGEAALPPGSLSQFEVLDTLPDGTSQRYVSLTHGQSSVFPLVISKIPAAGDAAKLRPDGSSSLDDVLSAISEWEKARLALDLPEAGVDQASDSVAPDKSQMAALACTAKGPRLLVIPLKFNAPADVFGSLGVVALTSTIRLSCSVTGDEEPPASGETEPQLVTDGRYATDWENPKTVRIFREVYDENDQATRTDLLRITMDNGELRISTAGK